MCKYCEQDESIFYDREGSEGGIREVVIEQDGTLSVSSNNFDRKEADRLEKMGFTFGESVRHTMYDVSIKINYCPMCGRKLVSESELISKTYEDGRNEAWELARKIGSYEAEKRVEIFDDSDAFHFGWLLENYSPQEALAKIEAYEESKIEVGDVIAIDDDKIIVTKVIKGEPCTTIYGIEQDGCAICYSAKQFEKTGRHIDIEHLLEQIRGGMSRNGSTLL